MPAERLPVRKITEVLRLKSLGLSTRQIAASLRIGRTTVGDYLGRAKAAKIAWPLPEDLDERELLRRLFVPREDRRRGRPPPDWAHIHTELRRKHVTLMLLWQEYKAEHPDGYQYSQFCDLYRRWSGKLSVWMRQGHRGGEKLFVDYSGDGIWWTDPKTGQRHEAQLFVATLGASSLTYAEATRTQQLRDWIRRTRELTEKNRALRFARRVEAGTVWVNTYRSPSMMSPAGGFKESGYGKHNGFEAVREFSRLKNVVIDHSGALHDPFVMRLSNQPGAGNS